MPPKTTDKLSNTFEKFPQVGSFRNVIIFCIKLTNPIIAIPIPSDCIPEKPSFRASNPPTIPC